MTETAQNSRVANLGFRRKVNEVKPTLTDYYTQGCDGNWREKLLDRVSQTWMTGILGYNQQAERVRNPAVSSNPLEKHEKN